jgi:hypothetical protein
VIDYLERRRLGGSEIAVVLGMSPTEEGDQ